MCRHFRNLYCQPGFKDHNYSVTRGEFEQVNEEWIEARLRDYFRGEWLTNPSTGGLRRLGLDPDVIDTIRLTLGQESCEKFLRIDTAPSTRRDYFLSKLRQYLLLTVGAAFDLTWRRVVVECVIWGVVDQVPDSLLPSLPEMFNIGSFVLQLDRYCPVPSPAIPSPAVPADKIDPHHVDDPRKPPDTLDCFLQDFKLSMFLEPASGADAEPKRFPRRAAWLRSEMKERDATPYSLHKVGGPDPKTIKRILGGERVRDESLDHLKKGLAFGGTVGPEEILIPSD